MRFTHETLPQRVVFAAGESPVAVAAEVEALGGSRVMLIASGREKELADPIAKEIPVVLRHEEVVMHVPVEVAGEPDGRRPTRAWTSWSASAAARPRVWPRRWR
ncbi:hypothetical protein SALBM311S_08195 [Streptomyces alboniger]